MLGPCGQDWRCKQTLRALRVPRSNPRRARGASLREAALSLGDATPAQLDEWLQAGAMLGPHIAAPQRKG